MPATGQATTHYPEPVTDQATVFQLSTIRPRPESRLAQQESKLEGQTIRRKIVSNIENARKRISLCLHCSWHQVETLKLG